MPIMARPLPGRARLATASPSICVPVTPMSTRNCPTVPAPSLASACACALFSKRRVALSKVACRCCARRFLRSVSMRCVMALMSSPVSRFSRTARPRSPSPENCPRCCSPVTGVACPAKLPAVLRAPAFTVLAARSSSFPAPV